MTRTFSCGAILALCVCALACSSKHGVSDAGTGGTGYYGNVGGASSPFGTGGTRAGTGTGAGTGGTGTAGTLGGTGGMTGTGGRTMMGTGGRMATTVTCNTSVTSVASCGGTTCPAVPMNAQMCTVNCCMNNMCGTQRALMTPTMMTTTCTVPAMPDSRCPSETVNRTMRQGCCTADNQCGLISTRNMTCQPRNQVSSNLMPLACDETDAGH